MAIYTRTGDQMITGLYGGKRVPKHDPRIHLIGDLDEANSSLGFARFYLSEVSNQYPEVETIIIEIQNSLFDISAIIACSNPDLLENLSFDRFNPEAIDRLEKIIDMLDTCLDTLKNFIHPNGYGSIIMWSRSLIRRCERNWSELNDTNHPSIGIYLNRISDLLFVLARYVNFVTKCPETIWSATSKSIFSKDLLRSKKTVNWVLYILIVIVSFSILWIFG